MFGPDLLVALAMLFGFLAVPLWAIIAASNRPGLAFYASGSNKTARVDVLVVAFFFGIGWLLGGYYPLLSRPRVRRQMQPLGV
jgi:RsiW-degrading membrane proteinase PrsW (M82 family)